MVSSNTAELVAQLDNISRSTIDDSEADIAAIKAALFAAHRRVQSPWDNAMDLCWTQVASESVNRTLVQAGLFEKWVNKGGRPASGQELADLTGELLGMVDGKARSHFVFSDRLGTSSYRLAVIQTSSRSQLQSCRKSVMGLVRC